MHAALLVSHRWPGEVGELLATVETVTTRVDEQFANRSEGGRLVLGLQGLRNTGHSARQYDSKTRHD
jgi:hypothetical protein